MTKEVSLTVKIEGLINQSATATTSRQKIRQKILWDFELVPEPPVDDDLNGGIQPNGGVLPDYDDENGIVGNPPSAVTNLSVSDITSSTAKVTWSAPSTATSYRVIWGMENQAPSGDFETSNTYLNLSGLTQGTKYGIIIFAQNEFGISNYTAINFMTVSLFPEGEDDDYYDYEYEEREHYYEDVPDEVYGEIPVHSSTHTLIVNNQSFTKTINTNIISWEVDVNVPIRNVTNIHWSTTDNYNWDVKIKVNNRTVARSISGNESSIRLLVLKRVVIPIMKKESTTKVRRITGVTRSGFLEQRISNWKLREPEKPEEQLPYDSGQTSIPQKQDIFDDPIINQFTDSKKKPKKDWQEYIEGETDYDSYVQK